LIIELSLVVKVCDTFVILSQYTKNGNLLFGKNSDRVPDEVQNIVFIKGGKHSSNEMVKCTYIEVPQVEETYDVVLSQPFWMYGGEMGVNKFGLVIGNEAVFTKEPLKKIGLLGMDIIRLVLERKKTAESALLYIIELLEKYGQGGNCEYRKKNSSYHNSWIVADPNEAYVLETAGKHWVWKEIDDAYSISNSLTIENDFDGISDEAIKNAIKKGFCRDENDFSFKKCYTAKGLSSAAIKNLGAKGDKRRNFHNKIINELASKKEAKIEDIIRLLRSHKIQINEDQQEVEYDPSRHSSFEDICVHYSGMFVPSQSVNSMAVESSKDIVKIWTTCGSAPCIQFYKPIVLYRTKPNSLPSLINFGTDTHEELKIWWRNEFFHRLILMNYPNWTKIYFKERNKFESDGIKQLDELVEKFRKNSNENEINNISQFIEQYFQNVDNYIKKYIEEFLNQKNAITAKKSFLKKWNKFNIRNKMPILTDLINSNKNNK